MNDSNKRRRLYVSMLVWLDGYIEGPHQELDFFPDGDPQFQQYVDEMIDSVGVGIYGRRSYETMVAYWPNAEKNPRSANELSFAQRMNALPKVVLSHRLEHTEWKNTRIVGTNVREEILALKAQPGKPIVAWAGAGLVRTLTELDLVDEYRVLICPTLLGAGTPLFSGLKRSLKLIRTAQVGAGLAALCYEPLRT